MKHVPGSKPISFGTGLLATLLFAIIAVPVGALAASETHPAHGFGPVYDAAHETTLKAPSSRSSPNTPSAAPPACT